MPDIFFLSLLFFAALLYTSVGHAGASGYLAVMAFYLIAPETMRPAALVLNIVAAVPTTIQFVSAGHFDRRLFLPLVLGSIPLAVIGGSLALPLNTFKLFIAMALIAAAIRLAWPIKSASVQTKPMPVIVGIVLGAILGLLAGLTSIGGGVYLTPILLFAKWAEPKKAAGVSSAFILVNSIAGLAGQFAKNGNLFAKLPDYFLAWIVTVLAGSLIGSTTGSRKFGSQTLRRLLAVVLVIAVGKLVFG